LKRLLKAYLIDNGVTARRMREVLFPACLAREVVTREELKQELVTRQMVEDPTKAGFALSGISVQVGTLKNDFLRQVLSYEYPRHWWEKDNYRLRPEYRKLVAQVLEAPDA
jgi:hypothetical protein